MIWIVRGTHRSDRDPHEFRIEAATELDARFKATAAGLIVSSIAPADPLSANQTTKSPRARFRRASMLRWARYSAFVLVILCLAGLAYYFYRRHQHQSERAAEQAPDHPWEIVDNQGLPTIPSAGAARERERSHAAMRLFDGIHVLTRAQQREVQDNYQRETDRLYGPDLDLVNPAYWGTREQVQDRKYRAGQLRVLINDYEERYTELESRFLKQLAESNIDEDQKAVMLKTARPISEESIVYTRTQCSLQRDATEEMHGLFAFLDARADRYHMSGKTLLFDNKADVEEFRRRSERLHLLLREAGRYAEQRRIKIQARLQEYERQREHERQQSQPR